MIMTKKRNNLLVVTLDALMMLFINGPFGLFLHGDCEDEGEEESHGWH